LSLTLGQAQAWVDAARISLAAATDPDVSISSANPAQYVAARGGNAQERGNILRGIENYANLIERVMGSFHGYAATVYQELRFGNAVESAFATVRATVDQSIASLIPDGLPKLTAALEAASSSNPEHWANAAAGCRRLIKAAADALQTPSPPVNGRPMTDGHYINRLVFWIEQHQPSGTAREMTTAELEHLGARIDAVTDAGHQGAHAEVTKFAASRYVTGTYLLLGDILKLAPRPVTDALAASNSTEFAVGSEPPEDSALTSGDRAPE
jgi:hypothetical protein